MLSGSLVERLLDPVPPELFVAEHWDQQRALRIPGAPGQLDGFYSPADLSALLDAVASGRKQLPMRAYAGEQRRVNPLDAAVGRSRVIRGYSGAPDVPIGHVDEWLVAGGSVVLVKMGEADEKIAALEAGLRDELSYPGAMDTTGFVSARGAGFFGFHFDAEPSITLQLHGEKTWYLAETPAVRWPRGSARIMPDGSPQYHFRSPAAAWEELQFRPDEIREVVLKGGDRLFLPAGAWHRVVASTDAGSISFVVKFYAVPADGVCPAVAVEELANDPSWRHLPISWPPYRGPGLAPRTREFYRNRLDLIERWMRTREEAATVTETRTAAD